MTCTCASLQHPQLASPLQQADMHRLSAAAQHEALTANHGMFPVCDIDVCQHVAANIACVHAGAGSEPTQAPPARVPKPIRDVKAQHAAFADAADISSNPSAANMDTG